jgi:hypothetical protein
MAKRSPKQVLDALDAWDEDNAIDAEMERVLAMTPEQVENDLRTAGIDVEAERTKAREWREKAARGEIPAIIARRAQPEAAATPAAADRVEQPPSEPASGLPAKPAGNVVKMRMSARTRWAALLAAATLALLVGALLMPAADMAGGGRHSFRQGEAAELRRNAVDACNAQRWDACLRNFDLARDRDPDGDKDPLVQEYRQRAERALKEAPPVPSR